MSIKDRFIEFCNNRNYIITEDKKFTDMRVGTDPIEYTCVCGTVHVRSFNKIRMNGDELTNIYYLPSCCSKNITNKDPRYKWYRDETIHYYKDPLTSLEWNRFQQYWISSNATIISGKGVELPILEGDFFKTSKATYPLIELVCKAFKIPEYIQGNVPSLLMDDNCLEKSYVERIVFKDSYRQILFRSVNYEEEAKSSEIKDIPFFNDLSISKNGYVFKKQRPLSISENQGFPTIHLHEARYRIDILMHLTFNPIEGQGTNYNTYKDNYTIIYNDNDAFNIRCDNLRVYPKGMSKTQIHNENKKKQEETLQHKIMEFVVSRKGKILIVLLKCV